MTFAPDFGVKLRSMGMKPDAEWTFMPFVMFNLCRVGKGKYSTMSNIDMAGVEHAVSLDFEEKTLQTILSLLPDKVAEATKRRLAAPGGQAVMVEFPHPVELAITTKLGEVLTNDEEEYIPLVIQEVKAFSRD